MRCGLNFKRSRKHLKRQTPSTIIKKDITLPEYWDWRNVSGKCFVTKPKDQGTCGCCYAFSACSVMESVAITAQYVNNKYYCQNLDYSEQNSIDCSQSQGNSGCDGGEMDNVFQYVISNKGINSEKSYPYRQMVFLQISNI
jgi:cathepsin L